LPLTGDVDVLPLCLRVQSIDWLLIGCHSKIIKRGYIYFYEDAKNVFRDVMFLG